MAVEVLIGCGFILAGTDYSSKVKEILIDDGNEEFDNTVMSHSARSAGAALANPTVTVKFLQDFAASIHDALQAAKGTTSAMIIRRKASVIRSGTNPEWHFTGFLPRYQPFAGGAVGVVPEPSVTFKSAGTPFTYLTTAS